MFKNWTIGKKLFTSVGISVVLTCVVAGVAILNSTSMRASQREAVVAGQRMRLAGQLKTANANMFAAEKAMIVAGASSDADRLTALHKDVETIMAKARKDSAELAGLVVTDEDRKTIASLEAGMKAWETGCAACHDDAATMGEAATMQKLSAKTQALVDANQKLGNDLEVSQSKVFEAQAAQADATAVRSVLTTLFILVATLVVGGVALQVVRGLTRDLREVSRELNEGVTQLFSAASQVASSSQTLSQSSSEQAASLEETSATMQEMSSMTRQNAANSKEAAQVFARADEMVRRAEVALNDMVEAMTSIRDSSGKVAKIIKTVDEIAFQTNILALNAAVEAARAGEAGLGFAVVADEVRNLALRSAQAAKDTANLIDESMAASTSGTEKVDHLGNTIRDITAAIGQAKQLVDEVSTASVQQATGFEQVSHAIAEMEKVTQSTAATAEESAAASEELNAQAEVARSQVQRLEVMVSRSTEAQGGSGRRDWQGAAGHSDDEDKVISWRRAS
jgi:methyl-accepting chemotaxis protein/methyl-accepting chemotaxis protein-1 (serine sensor receptor)